MTDPEHVPSTADLLDPSRHAGRVEPGIFDAHVHAAGALDWLSAGHEDPTEFAASLYEFVANEGFKPLAVFSERYVAPDTYDTVDRYTAALDFLRAQGMSKSLVDSLNAEMLHAVQTANDTDMLSAVISTEALARGEYDPFQLIYNGVIMQARDFKD